MVLAFRFSQITRASTAVTGPGTREQVMVIWYTLMDLSIEVASLMVLRTVTVTINGRLSHRITAKNVVTTILAFGSQTRCTVKAASCTMISASLKESSATTNTNKVKATGFCLSSTRERTKSLPSVLSEKLKMSKRLPKQKLPKCLFTESVSCLNSNLQSRLWEIREEHHLLFQPAKIHLIMKKYVTRWVTLKKNGSAVSIAPSIVITRYLIPVPSQRNFQEMNGTTSELCNQSIT